MCPPAPGNLLLPDIIRRAHFSLISLASWIALLLMAELPSIASAARGIQFVQSAREETNAVLHNPDMGWVVYENYPVDDSPNGSSTMLTMPGDSFPEVDAVALMFSWADIETSRNFFDFSKLDRAYDYWAARGKEIQLRISAEPLMLHVLGQPLAGTGPPKYLLDQLPPEQRQVRHMDSESYTAVDARNPLYQFRLKTFLRAVHAHFDASRPVSLLDLRGFGAWGEWHSGFRYESIAARRQALRIVLDAWCASLPHRLLALSYSYDPDGPPELFAGSAEKFDPAFTNHYSEYLKFSAFDLALKMPAITFRRDGCGGAVHSNERKLNEEAFLYYHRAPIVAEFLGSYSSVKKGGSNWVSFMVNDALSQHPNYLNLIGWQSGDARLFSAERPDLINLGLRRMGYRFVPAEVKCQLRGLAGRLMDVEIVWLNRGVGRALRDYNVRLLLRAPRSDTIAVESQKTLPTSQWFAGQRYTCRYRVPAPKAGEYELCIAVIDPLSNKPVQLPLTAHNEAGYLLGTVFLGPR